MLFCKKQLELGYAGLALLRSRLFDKSREIQKTIDEIVALSRQETGSEKEIKEYNTSDGYRAWADNYDYMPNLLIHIEEPVVKKILKAIPPGKTLDAACGTGRYSKFLSSLGHEVTGVDNSKEMLRIARKKDPQASFVSGSIEKMPFNNSSFDTAIVALALTHFSGLDKSISELSRIIKRDGKIIISDIHPYFVMLGGQAEFQDSKGNKGFIRNHTHSISDYLTNFKRNNLEVIQCREIELDPKFIDPSSIGIDLSKKTMVKALSDIPIVLIWELQKKK